MYNTIKSGIAVGNWVLTNTSSAGSLPSPVYEPGGVTELPEGDIEFTKLLNVTTSSNDSSGYTPQKLPFEALYKPSAYFNTEYVTGGLLYDKFYQLTAQAGSPSIANNDGPLTPDLRGTKLYEFAMDSFPVTITGSELIFSSGFY